MGDFLELITRFVVPLFHAFIQQLKTDNLSSSRQTLTEPFLLLNWIARSCGDGSPQNTLRTTILWNLYLTYELFPPILVLPLPISMIRCSLLSVLIRTITPAVR